MNLLFFTALIQQTGRDLVTLGCQGKSGGAMAVEATVGESQLQRIIRDLHGTLPLCVCMCETGCGHFFLEKQDKISHRDLRDISTLSNTWYYLAALIYRIILENGRVSHSCC